MNAKKSLCILLEALGEMGGKAPRGLLTDFVLGTDSKAIKQNKLEENELFGSGDEQDEDHYNAVIDEAIKQKLMSEKNGVVSATAKGKKAGKDTEEPFNISEGEDDEDAQPEINGALPTEDDPVLDMEAAQIPHDAVGSRSKLKIKLIQAIDRKVALDDFAQQQNVDFHEVLDLVESLKQSGRKIDLNYFLQEVLDDDSILELNECFEDCNGSLQAAQAEMDDVYSPEEIRLAYLQWKK